MPKIPDTNPIQNDVCPNCGNPMEPEHTLCPFCGFMQESEVGLTPTGVMPRNPALWTSLPSKTGHLGKDTMIVFQFLPSGSCQSYTLDRPLVMGRDREQITDDFLDLSEFQAEHHGISRQHCRVWRLGDYVLIMDLDSTNGTYLNGERLITHQAYVVKPDARLVLGSLHVVVTFS